MKSTDISTPLFTRRELLEDLYNSWRRRSITGFFGPPGSGKTTLIREFQKDFRKAIFIHIDFAQKDKSPFDLLKHATGADLENKYVDGGSPVQQAITAQERICVVFHNAHAKYDEKYFWTMLIRQTEFIATNVHFIVSAPCSCSFCYGEVASSLTDFQLRSSLLLKEPEATAFLNQPYPQGLHNDLKDRNILNVLVDSCQGNLLALRTSVDLLNSQFDKIERPSFSEVLRYYLSDEVTLRFECCFGPLPKPAVLDEHRELLRLSCFCFAYIGCWDLNDVPSILQLVYCGILINKHGPYVQCASPLAARYLTLALTMVDK